MIEPVVTTVRQLIVSDPLRTVAVVAIVGGVGASKFDQTRIAQFLIGVGLAFVAGRLIGPQLTNMALSRLTEVIPV